MGEWTTTLFFLAGLGLGIGCTTLAAAAILRSERRAAVERAALLQQTDARLREAFTALATQALDRNNRSFLELAKGSLTTQQQVARQDLEHRHDAIGQLLKPIQESLSKVEEKLQSVEKERYGHYKELAAQLKATAFAQERLQSETANLVKALRSPNVRGRWGELQLKRVVEMAGMLEHCDFWEQPSLQGESGPQRPDVIVRLPGGKQIIVDAKAPLEAYLEALEAGDDARREIKLKEHARQVRAHMSKLAAKSYWQALPSTPEFVVMFLPGETFFSAALQHDPSLIEFGVDQKVIPASPTTLIALLRAVAYGWQQEQVAENAQAISELGRTLYERLLGLAGHFDDVRKGLDRAVESYNKAVGSLESRVLVTARRFRDLGVTRSRELPQPNAIEGSARPLRSAELEDPQLEVPEPDESRAADSTADRAG